MDRNKFREKGFALGPGFSRYLSIMVGTFASACRYLAGSGSRKLRLDPAMVTKGHLSDSPPLVGPMSKRL